MQNREILELYLILNASENFENGDVDFFMAFLSFIFHWKKNDHIRV